MDCCPESWIGDGYPDCKEQVNFPNTPSPNASPYPYPNPTTPTLANCEQTWGCDLSCYAGETECPAAVSVQQHGQSAPYGRAPARLLRLLRARLAALGSSALPGRGPATGVPATASGA